MARLRWVAITLAPPLVYVMVLYLATRPPKPVYTFARHTVMTVTDKGLAAILHAPPAIYPPQALRAKVEGSVILNVTIAADGVMVLYLATRPPKPVYTFARHTVVTVTDKGGPAILHAPPAIYPPQALRAKVEGSVILNVTIAADGTVARAVPISGPEPLRRAAIDNVRRWQFEAKAQEAQIDVGFSPRYATH